MAQNNSPLRFDLNADLGETTAGNPVSDDAAMAKIVSSANVACGFHAGDPHAISQTIAAAQANQVTVGAHVGITTSPVLGVDSSTTHRPNSPMKPCTKSALSKLCASPAAHPCATSSPTARCITPSSTTSSRPARSLMASRLSVISPSCSCPARMRPSTPHPRDCG